MFALNWINLIKVNRKGERKKSNTEWWNVFKSSLKACGTHAVPVPYHARGRLNALLKNWAVLVPNWSGSVSQRTTSRCGPACAKAKRTVLRWCLNANLYRASLVCNTSQSIPNELVPRRYALVRFGTLSTKAPECSQSKPKTLERSPRQPTLSIKRNLSLLQSDAH